jgi:hypothetical protein
MFAFMDMSVDAVIRRINRTRSQCLRLNIVDVDMNSFTVNSWDPFIEIVDRVESFTILFEELQSSSGVAVEALSWFDDDEPWTSPSSSPPSTPVPSTSSSWSSSFTPSSSSSTAPSSSSSSSSSSSTAPVSSLSSSIRNVWEDVHFGEKVSPANRLFDSIYGKEERINNNLYTKKWIRSWFRKHVKRWRQTEKKQQQQDVDANTNKSDGFNDDSGSSGDDVVSGHNVVTVKRKCSADSEGHMNKRTRADVLQKRRSEINSANAKVRRQVKGLSPSKLKKTRKEINEDYWGRRGHATYRRRQVELLESKRNSSEAVQRDAEARKEWNGRYRRRQVELLESKRNSSEAVERRRRNKVLAQEVLRKVRAQKIADELLQTIELNRYNNGEQFTATKR